MGAVRFKISGDLLREALHMPPSSRFLSATVPWSGHGDEVEVVVADEAIPGDLARPHEVDPTVIRTLDGGFVWDWNVDA